MANERRNRSHSSTTTLASNNIPITSPVKLNPSSSQIGPSSKLSQAASDHDFTNVDPDTLFVKYSISEIRAIQVKLKSEAEAKQEELRLMVGERYRDLLQASTSITTMADSSRRVVDSLHRMKKITSSVPEHKPRRVAILGSKDNHLKILQSLAAHLKLLLDAPESLWRFLERKEYLNATWLFLLSRVVHRALMNESLAEIPWSSAGINIETQFPIAQKQWELISQFRSQIAHRAAQFFKETFVSSNTACTTLLSLHLLDSLPLIDALSTFLSQRSRILDSLLESRLHPNSAGEKSTNSAKRNVQVNHLQKAILDVIEIICGTMCTARDIFHANETSTRSMIEQHLENLQSSDPSKPLITTPSLLSALPSSAHLLLLPRAILAYKPYIDLTSPSTRVDPLILDSRLSSWLLKALESFGRHFQNWLLELTNIDEVWSTREKILGRLSAASQLKESEKATLQEAIDNGVRVRTIELFNLALESLEDTVQQSLQNLIQSIGDNNDQIPDATPSFSMFSFLELPSIAQIQNGSAVSPFLWYKAAMRHRIEGQTPFLLNIQQKIESQAFRIRADMDIIQQSTDEAAQTLRQRVMKLYKESLLAFSSRLSEILETFVHGELVTREVHNLDTFLARLCYHLSQSQFLEALQFASLSEKTLAHTLHRLLDYCIDFWQNKTVLRAFHAYGDIFTAQDEQPNSLPTQPSGCLMSALLIINSSLSDLGLPKQEIVAREIISKKLLASLVSVITEKLAVGDTTCKQLQILWDVAYLWRLQAESTKSTLFAEKLETKLKFVCNGVSDVKLHLDRSTSAYLLRSQTLFGPLIDPLNKYVEIEKNKPSLKAKPTPLLRLGTPDVEQDYLPVLGIAKPSIRFTMLSIGSTDES